ncbi:NlpC/P60 family protein [Vibrio sp. LaRot3]|uniref:NlpC/P60 family protein n=1 Tax=Vibrio sp. LaRot3 TaxID=2998829 RepID=UPI0022CDC89C|nr:NlpC/P60 family protein [Vibrio sp. LaRot3]MDA0147593.1 NlpC/P60 family protein [Vibrio sp. LaRot3]
MFLNLLSHLSRGVSAICAIGLLVACSSSPDFSRSNQSSLSPEELQTKQKLMDVYQIWQGAPYRLGGTSLNGVDCSAFVQTAYSNGLQVNLPRTTKTQVEIGRAVDYDQAKVGDLVFFKTSYTTRHVGIYLGNKQFMHASTSKGVIISRLDNPYWAGNFWQFRRVMSPPL